jgi:hypothetical protein
MESRAISGLVLFLRWQSLGHLKAVGGGPLVMGEILNTCGEVGNG